MVIAGVSLLVVVQDFVILLFSVRRDGKSLTRWRIRIGLLGGIVAYVAVLSIIVILLGATTALIVVNALKSSPWGHLELSP